MSDNYNGPELARQVIRLRAEVARLRAALGMAREALPRRDSLPNTKTRIGDIIDAVDAAIATQAPGDSHADVFADMNLDTPQIPSTRTK